MQNSRNTVNGPVSDN